MLFQPHRMFAIVARDPTVLLYLGLSIDPEAAIKLAFAQGRIAPELLARFTGQASVWCKVTKYQTPSAGTPLGRSLNDSGRS